MNSQEQKRLLMDLDVNMRTVDCFYTVTFYGALFREVRRHSQPPLWQGAQELGLTPGDAAPSVLRRLSWMGCGGGDSMLPVKGPIGQGQSWDEPWK